MSHCIYLLNIGHGLKIHIIHAIVVIYILLISPSLQQLRLIVNLILEGFLKLGGKMFFKALS